MLQVKVGSVLGMHAGPGGPHWMPMQESPGTLRQRDGRACVYVPEGPLHRVCLGAMRSRLVGCLGQAEHRTLSKPSRVDNPRLAPPAQTGGLGSFSSVVGQSMTNRPSARPCAHWPDRDDFVHNAGLMSWQ